MSEIVKYHNDFNKIQLPSFTEIEQDLLCGLMVKLKEEKGKVTFYPWDLRNILKSSYDNNSLMEFASSLKRKFFKADFTIIEKTTRGEKEVEAHKTINLFTEFAIYVYASSKELESIEIQVNPQFEYILNQLTANFTAFELSEFIALSGKYTKTLYRLLKQFRTTGKARFEWEEFCRVMDIPQDYRQSAIDKWILKPAIKELSKERNLFDQVRVPFKNLAYEKEKAKGTRGRGGKVSGISFTFKPESVLMQKLEKESQKIMSDEQKYLKILNNMKLNQAKFEYDYKLWQFNDFDFNEFKIIAIELVRDEYENLNFGNFMHFNAKNQEQFFKMIDTFRKGIR
ncbi:replication initiation protein [Campylobacter coli]|uniref:Replication initiation protein n=4 Tax=Pseudomonadati TaxID=3379134 RepID=A0A691X3X6_CAMCO|nr:replication initiation protein [Campylobacter coli]EAH5420339.1 RepB family plasmid replication initiator protein [Campylobacter coli]EAH6288171.1 RepB family plasmid replication initiator protein [Campylobacter coli]EAH7777770.1 RepB family plasmid replication initiator protein [Campylobacter coli]EAH9558192.1 RepB family plasmid replication initiator protein [Campylobacter coli]EAI0964068.1 RepB family plasmid replication initiator protein [Campylobacter coli]